ncbi:MAG: hypothetical protein ACI9NC_003002, partial [Verrucomicrobiales bacterium]
ERFASEKPQVEGELCGRVGVGGES